MCKADEVSSNLPPRHQPVTLCKSPRIYPTVMYQFPFPFDPQVARAPQSLAISQSRGHATIHPECHQTHGLPLLPGEVLPLLYASFLAVR